MGRLHNFSMLFLWFHVDSFLIHIYIDPNVHVNKLYKCLHHIRCNENDKEWKKNTLVDIEKGPNQKGKEEKNRAIHHNLHTYTRIKWARQLESLVYFLSNGARSKKPPTLSLLGFLGVACLCFVCELKTGPPYFVVWIENGPQGLRNTWIKWNGQRLG